MRKRPSETAGRGTAGPGSLVLALPVQSGVAVPRQPSRVRLSGRLQTGDASGVTSPAPGLFNHRVQSKSPLSLRLRYTLSCRASFADTGRCMGWKEMPWTETTSPSGSKPNDA